MPDTRATRLLLAAGLSIAMMSGVAAAQSPPDAYDDFLMARHLESEGNNPGALAALERAAAIDPKSAEVRAEIAAFHFRRNQRDLAEKNAKQALSLDEKNIEGNRILGLLNAAN